MRACDAAALTRGAHAEVDGYYAEGDGGGGRFFYDPISLDNDDGGTVIAPNSGAGRWIRSFDGDVNIRWFGAKGDGTTDDASALQAAIDASLRRGCGVYVPAGRFHVRRELTARGALRLRGDGYASVLDGAGVAFWQGDRAKDLGVGIMVDAELGSTTYASRGRLCAGATSLALDSVSGLSVGSDIYLELGVAASDSTQPFCRMFAKIAAIRGTTVVLDHAVPEDINGTSHRIRLNRSPARSVSIADLRSNYFTFSLNHIEGGNVSDIHFDAANWCFLVTDFCNLTIERIDVDVLQGVPRVGPALMEGWVIAGWGMRGLNVRDVRVRDLRGVQFFSSEAEPRQVFMDNIDLGLDDAAGNLVQVPVFICSGSTNPRPIQVRNLYIDVLAGWRRFNFANPYIQYENVYLNGNRSAGLPYSAPPDVLLSLSNLTGSLYYKNAFYSVRKRFHRVIPLAPGPGFAQYDLGVTGLLSQMRIWASSLKGVLGVYHGGLAVGTGINLVSGLTPGQFSQPLREATWIGAGDANYHTEVRSLVTDCDGAQSPGTYLVVEGEVLVSPTTPESAPETVVGRGPPSASSAFFGQYYYDSADKRLYYAVGAGSGRGDWIALSDRP